MSVIIVVAIVVMLYSFWQQNTRESRKNKEIQRWNAEHKKRLVTDKRYRDEHHERVGELVKRDYPHIGWD